MGQQQAEDEHLRAYDAAQRRRLQEEEKEILKGPLDSPDTRLVRGPDGQIYRVRNSQPRRHVKINEEEEEESNFQLVRGPDGRLYRMKVEQQKETKNESQTNEDGDGDGDKQAQKQEQSTKIKVPVRDSMAVTQEKPSKKKSSKKRVTIIVEDASDSETEDDEYKSVWRNRRPSPGKWKEPVEDFKTTH